MATTSDVIEQAGALNLFRDEETRCGPVVSYTLTRHQLSVSFSAARLWIGCFAGGAVRVTYAARREADRHLRPPDRSYAVTEMPEPVQPEVVAGDEAIALHFAGYRLRVSLADGRLELTDSHDTCWFRDLHGFRWNDRYSGVRRELLPTDRAYGLGEKTGPLEKRGRTYRMWNSDEPLHHPSRDPLYQSIPLLYLCGPAGVTGTFLDSTASSWFDVGDLDETAYAVTTEGHLFDSWLFPAPSLKHAVARFTELTGRPPLPPIWALGYQQSRYSYYPASRVREVAAAFRNRSIPCDVIHLDIDYMDGYRVFTWDRDRFPDPAGLIAELRAEGFRVVLIVDPGVKVDPGYETFDRGLAEDVFCRTAAGALYVGRVWPGEAAFPDFTAERARRFWAERVARHLDEGVSGIWNDMNEPADFSGDPNHRPEFTPPGEVVASGDGEPRSLDVYHNAYGLLMCEATVEGFQRHRPEQRPFILTRAGYAGIQRSAAVWTGDNHSWWEHLAMSIPMFANLGLSGVAFVGGDVGGFQLNARGELFARWMQLGALTPLFRGHTQTGSKDHEPWAFGPEVEAISRAYIELRYTLLPYLYGLFAEAAETGAPILRPLLYEFEQDERTWTMGDQCMLGPSLLAAPLTQPGGRSRALYLPAGQWFDYWSGRAEEGPVDVLGEAPLDRMPLYFRGPGLVPRTGVRQYVESALFSVLTVEVIPGGPGEEGFFDLYEDDGETRRYMGGEYRKTRFTLLCDDERWLTLRVRVLHGGCDPGREELGLRVWGVSESARAWYRTADAESELPEARLHRDTAAGRLRFDVPADVTEVRVCRH